MMTSLRALEQSAFKDSIGWRRLCKVSVRQFIIIIIVRQ